MSATLPERRHGAIAWLIIAVAICYANALKGEFLFDDYNVIVDNSGVHSWANWAEGLSYGIRPLLKFSYTLNWTMGAGVFGFHLSNLIIHLLNVCLVYRLTQVFVRQQWRAARLEKVPFLAALLFAIHPIHTEAITYVCGRSASLMMLFYLAGMLSYISGRLQGSKIRVYGLTPLFFLLALSVKETAVTFPLALLLWELSCGGNWPRAVRPQWPSWLLLLGVTLFFLFSESYLSQMERSARFNSLLGNTATQLSALAYLMKQWALPFWLNIDPDLPLRHDFSNSLVPAIFFLALVTLILAGWHRRPWVSFAFAWLLLHLIPLYLFLPRIDIANDRQMYLAGWPLLIAVSIELTLCLQGKALRLVATLIVLTLGSATLFRNQVYSNEITLWQDTVLKSPNKARVHNNLGYAYLLAKRHDEARQQFTLALQLDPHLYQARYNLDRLDTEGGIR
ncbi:MAG: tetratricopeptide repeat protein [Desulfobulbaceae bacterium]|nr:tetratricopeptide repeat protein [Desulfobulbaceae bacterium]